MKALRIFSKNAAFQRLEVLKGNRHKRYANGAFLVEGVRNLNEAVACGFLIESFLYAEGRPLSGWAREMLNYPAETHLILAPALMDEISGKQDASELMAIVKMRDDGVSIAALPDNPLLLLLDRPSNHGNLGAILRTADALGVTLVLLTGHGVDLYAPEVIGATMGSFFRVPAVRLGSKQSIDALLDHLRARYPNLLILGTTAHRDEAIPLMDIPLTGPVLMMIGNETEGLSRGLKERCDQLATIPMRPEGAASSLNIACATTVLIYEAVRQRGRPLQ